MELCKMKKVYISGPMTGIKDFNHPVFNAVHKAQGSQYRKVVFCALERDSFSLLDRALIYTAVTRTKQHCMVAGDIRAFAGGIKKVNHKRTVLQELSK